MKKNHLILIGALILAGASSVFAIGNKSDEPSSQQAPSASVQQCTSVMKDFNKTHLGGKIDPNQLSEMIVELNKNNRLPEQFVTKKQAKSLGWSPGEPFNHINALRGKSIGGDHFGNYEKRLPKGQYKEADLDYRGERRNAKRLVFQKNGKPAYVTIDHYKHFEKVPACHSN